MAEKTLSLQQRMPLDILQVALEQELQGIDDDNRIEELLRTEYQGENRLKKAFRQVRTTVKMNPMHDYLMEHSEEILSALKVKADRNLILSAVISAKYRFCYDLLVIMGKQLRLQDVVSSDVLKRLVGVKYGANKSCDNTIYYAVPQMLEAQLFTRPVAGEYAYTEPQSPVHKITWELWKESYYVNEPLTSREGDDYMFHPYFRFIKE